MNRHVHLFLIAFLAALVAVFVIWQVGAIRTFFTTPHLGSLSA